MKIKKFKNLWTMGLIIFGTILVCLYLLKLIFPEFVIHIAQVESISSFGVYIDTHLWAYYLFNFTIGFVSGYLYCCGACRKRRLSRLDSIILFIEVVLLLVVQKFLPDYYLGISLVCMIIMPAIMCKINHCTDIKYLYSMVVCFSVHSIAQLISLSIRDIGLMIATYNSATLTLLVIDVYIWQFLLYSYFNYKEVK